MSGRLIELIKDQDIFGHPIGVHYRGSYTFKTCMGSLCTLATYSLIVYNLMSIMTAFMDGSNQEDKTFFKDYDRFFGDEVSLVENHFEFALIAFPPIIPEIGQFKVY